MSSISKQALLVENNTSFPDNNTGYITPSSLRAFNVDMIDSTVNQATYSVDLAAVQADIAALEAFTASQQPSFTALNQFTASQTITNNNLNAFTQSATQELDSLSAWTGSWEAWTSSINEIRDDGVLQGYSTRFFFNGLVSASIVQNVNGPIANVTVESDGTKIGTASFNAFSASVNTEFNNLSQSVSTSINSLQSQIDELELDTGSYATTGSNTFNGDQFVNGFVSASNGFYSGPNTTALNIGDGSNIRFWSGSTGGSEYYNVQLVPGVGDIAFSRSGAGNVKVLTLAGVAGNNTTFQNNPVVFNDSVSSLTINAQSTAISGSGSVTVQASTITDTAASVTTNASASVRGTFDITGQSGGDGKAILLGHSGSLVIGNGTVNTYYAALAHLSSSAANANTNLIFKNSTATADTIVSGSANIFVNPAAPTAGFKRYIGTSNILTYGTSVPQISGSMAWSPTINGNVVSNNSNAFTFRGPVSSSASTIINNILMGGAINLGTSTTNHFEKAVSGTNFTGNALFNGTINAVASKTFLSSSVSVSGNLLFGAGVTLNHNSSSLTYASNVQNGGIVVNNNFAPAAGTVAAALSARVNVNTIYGLGHDVTLDGTNTSTSQTKQFVYNILAGSYLSASVPTGDSSSVMAVGMIGNSLIITGSSTMAAATGQYSPNNTQGSLFVGRYNAVDGNKAKTAETVFAVGTGISSARKTGFLIDSGSNTFVEGTLNVSGSLLFTGSVYGNVSASVISLATASIDLSVANYFTLTLSGSTNINVLNPKPGVTATLVINTDTGASASFSSNVKQPSGSFYAASPSGNIDIISFTAVNSSTVYAFPAQTFV